MSRSTVFLRSFLLLAAVLLAAVVAAPAQRAVAASHDNNIEWDKLGHNSRDVLYRSPGGPVETGTAVRLRLRAADGDLTGAQVRVWNDRINVETYYNMEKVASGIQFTGDPNIYEFWEYTLPASEDPTVYWYRFLAHDGSDTDYYEDDSARLGGWGETFDNSPDYSYQLTIYDPTFETPDWVKNAIIYQIFVDRFNDGDPENNPAAGEFFYGAFDTIFRSNAADWNAHICDPRNHADSSAKCPDKYSQNFYGGDLKGIIDKLDYLDDLGVTALYLNPIFESPSNHKYDTKDFMQIDDNFGDLDLFHDLVEAAESKGIKIILDGVFNHSSSDSYYFDRYSRWNVDGEETAIGTNDGSGACESTASPYVDWYTFFNYEGGGASPCSDNRDYPKWFGIFDSLPVFQHDNPDVRDYFIGAGSGATDAVGPYWIDQGAAGWRLDVAPEIDHGTINDPADDYWEAFRAAVKSVDPNAYIVGEEWGNPTSWTIDEQWDATMNYQFAAAVLSFMRDTGFTDNDFNGGSSAGPLNPIDAIGLAERLLNLQERYAPEAFAAMMNLFNSHDTNRVLFLLNHETGDNNVARFNDPTYDWSDSIARYKAALILQMTLPGAPTIYYGDEVGTVNPPAHDGSQWQDDPYNRAPFPWLEDGLGDPYYAHMQNETEQDALFTYVSKLTGIRNDHEVLRTGSFEVIETNNENVFAFVRRSGGQVAVVLVNKSDSGVNTTFDVSDYIGSVSAEDLLSNISYDISNGVNGETELLVPARGGRIFVVDGQTPPATVDDLTATAVGPSQIDLDWSDAAGATEYYIYRSRLSGGGYEFLGGSSDTEFSDTDVNTGVIYYYVIVVRNAGGVAGDWSNEASATPFIPIGGGWRNVQWPCQINNHVIGVNNYTEIVYSQIWVPGYTEVQNTPVEGIIAQLGFGPTSDAPSAATWTWSDMEHNPGYDFSQSNDEFQGQMLPLAVGSYKYTTRYSGDGGLTWHYAINGPNAGCTPGDSEPLRDLTVIASTDTNAPAAPTNLEVTGVTSASITLGWDAHSDTDGDLHGFRVHRGPVDGPYAQIAQINDSSAVIYVDTSVTAGETYEYYITAIDTSLNESADSNKVQATAENLLVDVTFRVTVPSWTPGDVYLAGNFADSGYVDWDPGAPSMKMTEVSPNTWEITLQILDGKQHEYKYARGSWDKVEKQMNGFDDVLNRPLTVDYGTDGTQLVEDTVANWRDRIVIEHSPANGATGVDPNTTVTATWNKWIPTPPPGTFTVTGPGGVVSGTFSWDDGIKQHNFTPDAPLAGGTYTVVIENNNDAGDNQYIAVTFSFTVPGAEPETEVYVTAAGGSAGGVAYKKNDILKWDGSTWSKWFDGAANGLTNKHDISAIAIPDPSSGGVYMSFSQNNVKLPGITGKVKGQDVVYFDGATYSMFLDGSDIGLTTGAEKIDSLEVITEGIPDCEALVIISIKGAGRINGLGRIRGEDILFICLEQSGEDTVIVGMQWLDGSEEGLRPNLVTAVSYSSIELYDLYFLAQKAFKSGGVTGGHSTVFAVGLDNSGVSGPFWRAADYGLNQKVDGLAIVNLPAP